MPSHLHCSYNIWSVINMFENFVDIKEIGHEVRSLRRMHIFPSMRNTDRHVTSHVGPPLLRHVTRDIFAFSHISSPFLRIIPSRQKLLRNVNLYHSLGIFSRRQNDVIFLIFPRKQDLTFHANCLLRRQFAWNVKSCFLGKIRKIFQNVVCWKFYPEC